MEVGGFNENSNYFIGILPDGTKKFYCLERDWREEYAELEEALQKQKEQEASETES